MRALIRVLAIGFAAVIVFLAVAAFISANNVRSISHFASDVVTDQLVITHLLDEVEQEQRVLNASLFGDPSAADPLEVLSGLDQTDREIQRLAEQASAGPDRQIWQNLRRATLDFSTEARQDFSHRGASGGRNASEPSRDLFIRHEAVTDFVATLVDVTHKRVLDSEQRVSEQTARLAVESSALAGGALVLALVCAVITVRIAARVFRQMESQTGELSRVSFRLLEIQEVDRAPLRA